MNNSYSGICIPGNGPVIIHVILSCQPSLDYLKCTALSYQPYVEEVIPWAEILFVSEWGRDSTMCDLEVKVVAYKFWNKAESAWKSNVSADAEVFFSLVTSMDHETDSDEEEVESVVLMVREGQDLLQHMQLSPWPENLPAVSVCVGSRSLLVQTDSAEGGIKFLVELEEGQEGMFNCTYLLFFLPIPMACKYLYVDRNL